ncbi:hypothetical protein OTK49_01105 [Vibrio coralliirubri]|uniref:hypothetical protein n=1 Tax=Vibrio coralliirubri TaxID=1516159 RepID=UPI002284E264|nr:hypothetical protein [Vibrio coralliirubri]MCY9861127.1 hypothetical protein [Vibrio coralliirubri]
MKYSTQAISALIATFLLTGCTTAGITIAGGNSYVYAPNSYILKVVKNGYTNITVTGHAGMILASSRFPKDVKTFCNDEKSKGETIVRRAESGETIHLTCPKN